VSRISALRRTTDVVEHREGGDPTTTHLVPGRTRHEPITLEQGISLDSAFEEWANRVSGPAGPQADFRKEIRIEVYDPRGKLALAYDVHRCWPSEYVALPALDPGQNVILIQTLTLQNEGWERDTSIG
jgi:phage tail-like protein